MATTGPLVDAGALGTIPANVRVERFVPKQVLLERAAVAMSHAGAGTVLGAARLAVPQLLFPIAADQWENADAAAAEIAAMSAAADHVAAIEALAG